MEAINIRVFRKKAAQSKKALRNFLTRIENDPPKDLDIISEQVDKEVWTTTDCLSCANCCKSMTPTYTFQDIKRISSHLNMRTKEFKQKWLFFDKSDKSWKNVKTPCQFLDRKTNLCTIYEVRPDDCAQFPHLTKKDMKYYLHVHRDNIVHCPATLKWVEKLKDKILLSRTRIKEIQTEPEKISQI